MLSWLSRKADPVRRQAAGTSRAAVLEQLNAAPCAAFLGALIERFPELDAEQAHDLVTGTVEGFFYEVMDLGASESYHHASPWGLAIHSLEVAARALRTARARHFVGHAAPNPEEQEYRLPRLRYAAFLFGLHHDVGKLAQAVVRGPNREVHNPFVEALGAFYERHGRDRCRVEWQSGRKLEDHLRHGAFLFGRLMPPCSAHYLGPAILAEVIEKKSSAAREIEEIILEADQRSVEEDRRRAEATVVAAQEGVGISLRTTGSVAGYVGTAFREGLRQGRFSLGGIDANVIVGQRYGLLRYPEAVLKLVGLVKDSFAGTDVTVRTIPDDEAGARFFLAKLKAEEKLFVDPTSGLWKLKATVRLGADSRVCEAVLIPAEVLGADRLGQPAFGGSVSFARPTDDSEVVVPGFEVLQVTPATPAPPPIPAMPPQSIPATLGPREGIDPAELVRHLVEGIVEGWIPTNSSLGLVYVSPRKTYITTPAAFLRMRGRGLYPEFDPQCRSSAYLRCLATLGFVCKSAENRIVYPILLGPESPRPLMVIKFDTAGLFTSKEVLDRVGFWKDWQRIIELPQAWRIGDAVTVLREDSDE